MPYSGKLISISLFLIFISTISQSQCLIPSPDADTLMPVVNRMNNIYTYGALERTIISQSVSIGNTIYIGGGFRNIGPNTGTGVVLSDDGTQLLTSKKWRINGPVYTSVPMAAADISSAVIFQKLETAQEKILLILIVMAHPQTGTRR